MKCFTVMLGLMCCVHKVSLTNHCPSHCKQEGNRIHRPSLGFKHLDPGPYDQSVAPWTIGSDTKPGREPEIIQQAVCMNCSLNKMVPKPISLTIYVYERHRGNNTTVWCRCPFHLAVGCTCVPRRK